MIALGKSNPLTQQVNLSLSVIFLGSFAFFMVVLLLEASEMENPIANHIAAIVEYENL